MTTEEKNFYPPTLRSYAPNCFAYRKLKLLEAGLKYY